MLLQLVYRSTTYIYGNNAIYATHKALHGTHLTVQYTEEGSHSSVVM